MFAEVEADASVIASVVPFAKYAPAPMLMYELEHPLAGVINADGVLI